MKTLLVVDDNKDVLTAVKLLMRQKVDEVVTTPDPTSLPQLIRKHKPQVVLLDMNFRSSVNNGNEGLFWLREIKGISSEIAVILFTAYADVTLAVEGMKIGATDFIVKHSTTIISPKQYLAHSAKRGGKRIKLLPRKCYGENRQKCSG